jgi:hypothetical protein
MGRPGELPRELSPPELTLPPEELPELKAVMAGTARRSLADPLDTDPARIQAFNRLRDMELRRHALELLLRMRILQTSAGHAEAESFLRDLKLDESRTLYEQEVRADLGYSMSRQTMARLQEEQVRYCRALAWAELAALQGQPVPPPPEADPAPDSTEESSPRNGS